MVISIRRSQHEEGEELVAIWCRSVDATHDFLSAEYRAELEELVRSFLPEAPLSTPRFLTVICHFHAR
ncbi:putative acetyltransferase [Escherichia coli]|nr:putative acetyltransferase [Escherichia coli]